MGWDERGQWWVGMTKVHYVHVQNCLGVINFKKVFKTEREEEETQCYKAITLIPNHTKQHNERTNIE